MFALNALIALIALVALLALISRCLENVMYVLVCKPDVKSAVARGTGCVEESCNPKCVWTLRI